MKTKEESVARTRVRFTGPAALLAFGLAWPGCASKGPEQIESAVESMRTMRASLGQSRNQIGTTVTALNTMVREPQPDLKPQYARFGEQLDLLDSQGQAIQKRASSMRQKRDAYLAAWDKELASVQSPDLKEKGQERREEVRKTVTKMEEATGKTREDYDALMRDLKDIRKYLSLDLNPTGLDSVKRQAQSATEKSEKVQKMLDDLIAQLDDLANRLAPSKRMGG